MNYISYVHALAQEKRTRATVAAVVVFGSAARDSTLTIRQNCVGDRVENPNTQQGEHFHNVLAARGVRVVSFARVSFRPRARVFTLNLNSFAFTRQLRVDARHEKTIPKIQLSRHLCEL